MIQLAAWLVGLALTALSTFPPATFADLPSWVKSLGSGAGLVMIGLAAGLTIAELRLWKTRAERVSSFIVSAKTVHDKLLSWGLLDTSVLKDRLDRLEQSDDAVWTDDDIRGTRDWFLYHAKRALDARGTRNDYRNELERAEMQQYLDSATDRLVAALLKKKIPPPFDPYEEWDDEPHRWWQLLRRFKRRHPQQADCDLAID